MKRIKKIKKTFIFSLLLGAGLIVTSLSEASSSWTIMRFIESTTQELIDAQDAALKAVRGEVVDKFATVETNPIVLKESLTVILRMNDNVQLGSSSNEDAAQLIQMGAQ